MWVSAGCRACVLICQVIVTACPTTSARLGRRSSLRCVRPGLVEEGRLHGVMLAAPAPRRRGDQVLSGPGLVYSGCPAHGHQSIERRPGAARSSSRSTSGGRHCCSRGSPDGRSLDRAGERRNPCTHSARGLQCVEIGVRASRSRTTEGITPTHDVSRLPRAGRRCSRPSGKSDDCGGPPQPTRWTMIADSPRPHSADLIAVAGHRQRGCSKDVRFAGRRRRTSPGLIRVPGHLARDLSARNPRQLGWRAGRPASSRGTPPRRPAAPTTRCGPRALAANGDVAPCSGASSRSRSASIVSVNRSRRVRSRPSAPPLPASGTPISSDPTVPDRRCPAPDAARCGRA